MEQVSEHDFSEAIRLLHILRAYSWTPGNVEDPARDDPMYPAEWRGRNKHGQLWQRVDVLLKKHPYHKPGTGVAVSASPDSGKP